jgi:hypothetical protein
VNEELVKTTLRLPVALVVRLDEAARAAGSTRTDLVHVYLARALSQRARAFDEMLGGSMTYPDILNRLNELSQRVEILEQKMRQANAERDLCTNCAEVK